MSFEYDEVKAVEIVVRECKGSRDSLVFREGWLRQNEEALEDYSVRPFLFDVWYDILPTLKGEDKIQVHCLLMQVINSCTWDVDTALMVCEVCEDEIMDADDRGRSTYDGYACDGCLAEMRQACEDAKLNRFL